MTVITRRTASKVLAGGLAVGLPLAAPAVWAQSNMTKLRAGLPPVLDATPFYLGLNKGMFAEERIDLELIPGPGGTVTMSAVLAGELQIGIATVTALLLAAAEGLNFQIVAPTSFVGTGPPEELGGLLIRKGSGLTSGAAMMGKRAGVLVLNNVPWLCLRLWIDSTGGDSSKVNLIEVPNPQMTDALVGNRVDMVSIIEPFFSAAFQAFPDKVDVAAYSISQMMPNTIIGAAMMTQEYTSKNKEVVHAFSRVYKKAIDWMNANKGTPELAQIVTGFTKLPPERVTSLRLWPRLQTTVEPAVLDRVAQAMIRYGLLKTAPNSAALIYETARG